jgi:hypothetical protein
MKLEIKKMTNVDVLDVAVACVDCALAAAGQRFLILDS